MKDRYAIMKWVEEVANTNNINVLNVIALLSEAYRKHHDLTLAQKSVLNRLEYYDQLSIDLKQEQEKLNDSHKKKWRASTI